MPGEAHNFLLLHSSNFVAYNAVFMSYGCFTLNLRSKNNNHTTNKDEEIRRERETEFWTAELTKRRGNKRNTKFFASQQLFNLKKVNREEAASLRGGHELFIEEVVKDV